MDLNLGYTDIIIIKARTHGLLRNQLAYVLATAYWETARTMKPVVEAFWKNEAWRKVNLAKYYPWYGRGFVQLTWKANYVRAGEKLGIDLITDPTVALKPGIAADILIKGMIEGWFTGKKLSDYITLQKSDFEGARKIINGVDKKREIASLARKYDQKLKEVGYGESNGVAERGGTSEQTPFKPVVSPLERQPDDPGVQLPEIPEPSVGPSFAMPAAHVVLEAIEQIFKLITNMWSKK